MSEISAPATSGGSPSPAPASAPKAPAVKSSPTPKAAPVSNTGGESASSFHAKLRGYDTRQPLDVAAAFEGDEPVETMEDDGSDGASISTTPVEDVEESVEEEVSAEESSEEDFSWLENVKQYKELHGMSTPELLEALSTGYLPEALFDKLKLKFKRGEEEWEGPIGKYRNEVMSQADYTRKMQAWSEEKKSFNTDKDEFLGLLHSWKGNPEKLMDGLENLGFPVLDLAKAKAARERALAEMTPEQRHLHEERQKFEKERAAHQKQLRDAEQARAQLSVKQESDKLTNFVNDTTNRLYQDAGIPNNEKTWGMFYKNLQTLVEAGHDIRQADTIQHAFEVMAEEYSRVWAKREQQAVGGQQPAGQTVAKKQNFSSPAREQVAKAGIVKKVQGGMAKRPDAMSPRQFSEMLKNMR